MTDTPRTTKETNPQMRIPTTETTEEQLLREREECRRFLQRFEADDEYENGGPLKRERAWTSLKQIRQPRLLRVARPEAG